jgi:hypothetical protein|mmetsp:Transcript_74609/g.125767  ORF Transcript_74609/g.125767 Transcript_74609/m.125767 type:complete len:80 (+) Transcript_74609:1693-1932(+)
MTATYVCWVPLSPRRSGVAGLLKQGKLLLKGVDGRLHEPVLWAACCTLCGAEYTSVHQKHHCCSQGRGTMHFVTGVVFG